MLNKIIAAIIEAFWAAQIVKKSKNYLQIKVLKFGITFLNGARKVTLLYFISLVAVVLLTASATALTLHALHQFQTAGYLFIDPAIIIFSSIFLIMTGTAFWCLQESHWLRVFGLHDHIRAIFSNDSLLSLTKESKNNLESVQKNKIEQIINDLLEEKLEQLALKKQYLNLKKMKDSELPH